MFSICIYNKVVLLSACQSFKLELVHFFPNLFLVPLYICLCESVQREYIVYNNNNTANLSKCCSSHHT